MEMAKTVEEYIDKHPKWSECLVILRSLATKAGCEEAVKWGAPAYLINGKNVVGIGAFKSYCGLWFHQGVFMADPESVLINAQEGVTKGLRQWRFQNRQEILDHHDQIRSYPAEARQNQLDGKEIKVEKKKGLDIPELLQQALDSSPDLQEQFNSFSPYKQREYAEYIAQAKREATRESRLEKITPMILQGVGLNDKYR